NPQHGQPLLTPLDAHDTRPNPSVHHWSIRWCGVPRSFRQQPSLQHATPPRPPRHVTFSVSLEVPSSQIRSRLTKMVHTSLVSVPNFPPPPPPSVGPLRNLISSPGMLCG